MPTIASQILSLVLLLTLVTDMHRITRRAKAVNASKTSEANEIQHTNDYEDNTSLSNNVASVNELSTNRTNITSTSYEIPYRKKYISCISIGSPASQLSLIFTQGAGGKIKSPAVMNFAEGFSELKNIVCFEGRSNLQFRSEMFQTVMERHHSDVIGGRSMGARAAITTAKDIENVKALILVSYPLKGANGDIRDKLLLDIDDGIDVLFVIGSEDGMCDLNNLRPLMNRMAAKTWLIVVHNANHGMEMRPSKATAAVGKMVGKVVAKWIEERNNTLTNCEVRWDELQNDVVVGPWNDGL